MSELTSQENASVRNDNAIQKDKDCEYEVLRIESVITAEQMERENFYTGDLITNP